MKIKFRLPGVFVIIIGTLLWLLSYFVYDEIWYIFMIIIGIFLLIRGLIIIKLTSTLNELQIESNNKRIIKGTLLIILGILLIIPWTNSLVVMIISIMTGVCLLVTLINNLIKSSNKFEKFKKDLYLYLLTFLIIAFGIKDIGRIIAIVVSSLIICYGIYLFVLECIGNYHSKDHHKKISDNEVIGTDYYVEDDEK